MHLSNGIMRPPEATAEYTRNSAFTYQIATQKLLKARRQQVSTYTKGIKSEISVKKGYDKRRRWSSTYDTIEIEFWDEKGFCGDSLHQFLVFDMDSTTRSHIFSLLEIARSPAPDAVATIKAADAAMLSATGISAIASALLRELLLSTAYRVGHTELIAFLADAGPPSTAKETFYLRHWVSTGGEAGIARPKLPLSVEAALVRGRWYQPETLTWGVDLVSRCCEADDDEAESREFFDALIKAGFFAAEKQRAKVLVLLTDRASAEMMEYALGRLPLEALSKRQASEVLCAAVGKGAARVKMLLNLGVDPNVASRWDVSGRPWAEGLPLHVAVQLGNEETVRLLLEHGAKMVPNGRGQSPLVLAEERQGQSKSDTEAAGILKLLEGWLETRGLPRNHEEMPTFVEDGEEVLGDMDDGKRETQKKGLLGRLKRQLCL